jgi:hypothetical protein
MPVFWKELTFLVVGFVVEGRSMEEKPKKKRSKRLDAFSDDGKDAEKEEERRRRKHI